jgi:hypothetical protein
MKAKLVTKMEDWEYSHSEIIVVFEWDFMQPGAYCKHPRNKQENFLQRLL